MFNGRSSAKPIKPEDPAGSGMNSLNPSDVNVSIAPAIREALESAVGSEHVLTGSADTESAATATFSTLQRIPALVRPGSRLELQAVLAVARRFAIPVYPVSSGKNWGYGSRVPVSDGCILIELSRMNRILGFDERLGWVTIEPGVTQQQLFEFLASQKSRLWIDATGSTPDSSVIGNTMERGFGHTPYGDHAANVCGFEIVLPDGDVLETGMARFAGAHSAEVYRWGLGPSLDGLFTQSNLGIVTRMTVWLMPAPDYFQAFFFRCDEPNGLPGIIDALRPLRMNGTLRSAIHIANDYKVIAGIRQYPWEEANGSTPLLPETLADLRGRMNFGVWNGSGGLYGTRAQVAEARRLLRKALKGRVTKNQFLDDRVLNFAGRFSRTFSLLTRWDISRALELVRPVYGLMKGIPTDRPLASAYWRKRNPPPAQMDPDRDKCGLMWCAPVAPTDGKHAQLLSDISAAILLRHGFEPMLSITLITERALICVISLTYDREIPGEDERARNCYQELEAELERAGYPPYRLGIQSMAQAMAAGPYRRVLEAIKRTVDPGQILAPGRYGAPPRKEF
jgi:4-cresol dehydrogenase (hydroxylating)